ncbi:MAG: TetR/AcrR family transcriptional regulator [bacterium]|nr:TetR/AcrR family transcriptional regulator [bacterium]
MKSTTSQKEMRHKPIQARSAKRVDLILDAASFVISESGYDNATTNEIAKRAGIPIGSLYQYFPNKDALLHALTKRYLSQIREFFKERSLTIADEMTLKVYLASVIDTLLEFRTTHKSFKQMFISVHMNNELSVASKELNDEFIVLVKERMSKEYNHVTEDRKVLACYMLLGMIRSLFMCMSLMDSVLWKNLVTETKRTMAVYLDNLS